MSEKVILPVKVDPSLKQDFEWACEMSETNASKELRTHMRNFSKEQEKRHLGSISLSGENPDPVTGINYAKDFPEDVRSVKRMIWLMRQFETLHPEQQLLPYEKREQMKLKAHSIASNVDLPMKERKAALMEVIRAHFCRSAMHTLSEHDPKSYRIHPGIRRYATHYIAANIGIEHAYAPIYGALSEEYPLDEALQMTDGSSYWKR